MDVAPTPHLERFESYEQACREFRWLIPSRLNAASAICRRHADAVTRIALSEVKEAGINTYTFGGLDYLSDKFAMALTESGVGRGDSVAVLLPPSAALAITHLGALKTGAVVVPLSMSADTALLVHALADSNSKALVVDEAHSGTLALVRNLPTLSSRFIVRDLRPAITSPEIKDFWSEVDRSSSDFDTLETDANSAAFIFYLESQGGINGVVHSHRSIIGQLAAFEMFCNVQNEADPVCWTAGDWSSPGEILGVLYPGWWYGCSLVSGAPEDAASTISLLARCEVTNVFMPARSAVVTALSVASNQNPQAATPALPDHLELKIRTIVAEAPHWPEYGVNSDPSVTMNEVYGRPETGWIFGTCGRLFATPAGSAGRPAPGRLVEIIDQNGSVLPVRHEGHIAIHSSDPGLFTEYHGAASGPADAFIGEWFLTGAVGHKNEDGDFYVSPSSRIGGAD